MMRLFIQRDTGRFLETQLHNSRLSWNIKPTCWQEKKLLFKWSQELDEQWWGEEKVKCSAIRYFFLTPIKLAIEFDMLTHTPTPTHTWVQLLSTSLLSHTNAEQKASCADVVITGGGLLLGKHTNTNKQLCSLVLGCECELRYFQRAGLWFCLSLSFCFIFILFILENLDFAFF